MTERKTHTAGALDIRAIIAYLIGTYGLILTGLGLFDFSEEDSAQTDGYNVNLWAGLAMLVFAAAFLIWNKVNPTEVPDAKAEHKS